MFHVKLGNPVLKQGWIHIDIGPGLAKPKPKPLVNWVVVSRKYVYQGSNVWNAPPVFSGPSTASGLCAWLAQKYGVPSSQYLDVTAYSSDGQTKLGHWVGPIGYIRGPQALACGD